MAHPWFAWVGQVVRGVHLGKTSADTAAIGRANNGASDAGWLVGETQCRYGCHWPCRVRVPHGLLRGSIPNAHMLQLCALGILSNLLPDSEAIRQRIRERYRIPVGDPFDLLAAIGRDCVGALQLLHEGKSPQGIDQINATPLDELEVERELRNTVSPTSMLRNAEDDFRLSIAGAQEKTAFTWHEGRWCKPHSATPTTHIFKLPLGLVGGRQMDMTLSLENEWLSRLHPSPASRIFSELRQLPRCGVDR